MDWTHVCDSINFFLRYPVILILSKTLGRGVVLIYCLKRPKMRGNNTKKRNIIGYQYFKTLKTTYKYETCM